MTVSRRTVITGISAMSAGAFSGVASAIQPRSGTETRVRALVGDWLDEQYAYTCAFRSILYPVGTAEHIVPAASVLRTWQETKRRLEYKTDRLINSPSVCRDDVVLKSAALGFFFAKERLPDCEWAVVPAPRWIGVLESEILAFGSPDIRTWRPEYEMDRASAVRAHDET